MEPLTINEIRLHKQLKKAQKALARIYVHVFQELPVGQQNMGNRLQMIAAIASLALDSRVPDVKQGSYKGPDMDILRELELLKAKGLDAGADSK